MLSIAFSWPAGSWVNTAGLIIATYLNKLGYKVYADKEYQSIIKGWNNTMIVYADEEDLFLTKKIDLFFAYDELAIFRNKPVYDIKHIVKIPQNKELFSNMVSVGAAFKALWVPQDEAISHLKEYFSYKTLPEEILQKNINSIKAWYDLDIPVSFQIKKLWQWWKFEDGNKVIADWAVSGGLEFYSAYPMTPASSLIKYLAKRVTFFQWEDEIAVAMSMLGARFAGKKAMCWTSWGGFALMTESISFANQAEIGGVYILSQRGWPSTWTPTFTEQWDVLFACNATFGDTKPIVVYPNTFENWYELIQKVLYWGEIYQHPIIVLLDKQFSESYLSLRSEELKEVWRDTSKIFYNPDKSEEFAEIETLKENKFLRYKLTDDWISAYTYPWVKNWEFIASSYEHTESGFSTEDPQIKEKMTEKRHKKLKTFTKNEFNENYYGYDIINPKAKRFIITMWINHLVCSKFVKENPSWWLITIKNIQPLDTRFTQYLKNAEKIVFVELNKSWQLQQIISSQIGLNCPEWEWKIDFIRKYDNYPLFIEDLDKLLQN